jgi:HEXXH motif-containing protein
VTRAWCGGCVALSGVDGSCSYAPLMEKIAKSLELSGPLPSPDVAWELLARFEGRSPKALDCLLTHPYTGSWAGYTIRLLRNGTDDIGPLWINLGHLRAVAAAAAIRAGLVFDITVPAWNGDVGLPTLGMARLAIPAPFRRSGAWGARPVHDLQRLSMVRLPDHSTRMSLAGGV